MPGPTLPGAQSFTWEPVCALVRLTPTRRPKMLASPATLQDMTPVAVASAGETMDTSVDAQKVLFNAAADTAAPVAPAMDTPPAQHAAAAATTAAEQPQVHQDQMQAVDASPSPVASPTKAHGAATEAATAGDKRGAPKAHVELGQGPQQEPPLTNVVPASPLKKRRVDDAPGSPESPGIDDAPGSPEAQATLSQRIQNALGIIPTLAKGFSQNSASPTKAAPKVAARSALATVVSAQAVDHAAPVSPQMAPGSPAKDSLVQTVGSPVQAASLPPAKASSPGPASPTKATASPSPAKAASPSPIKAASPSPIKAASPSPARMASPSPAKAASLSPIRAAAAAPTTPANVPASPKRSATKAKAVVTTVISSDEEDDSEADDDEDVIVQEQAGAPASGASPEDDEIKQHSVLVQSVKVCSEVLLNIKHGIAAAPTLVNEARKTTWCTNADDISTDLPKTVIGVLGNTGVGKSSLLNSLLDEASILPTSGSRGCTAAVVELKYNDKLKGAGIGSGEGGATRAASTPVYEGVVEFIKAEDWYAELKTLVDECCTQDDTLYKKKPEDGGNGDPALEAWEKIDQVYGKGHLARLGDRYSVGSGPGKRMPSSQRILQALTEDRRVHKILTAPPNQTNNSIHIAEGRVDVDSELARSLVLGTIHPRDVKKKREWAKNFRSEINTYVYRKGNGDEPQTWPLIKRVILHGPWKVLSSGACLVDLPGVRDSNAARAKVASTYLRNCSCIWIVAPIKRAVDDGTAKELLGEQFKRRMLMDGQYGNVSFICTQTDDCEATEIMRDHSDVAGTVPGRLEKMQQLFDELTAVGSQEEGLSIEETRMEENVDELGEQLASIKEEVKAMKADLKAILKEHPEFAEEADADANPPTQQTEQTEQSEPGAMDVKEDQAEAEGAASTEEDVMARTKFKEDEKVYGGKKAERDQLAELHAEAFETLETWREEVKGPQVLELDRARTKLQKELKPMCATVRNEYSTLQLKEDFQAGLQDMVRKPEDEEDNMDSEEENDEDNSELPDTVPTAELPVFCISANDYLKIRGIKPRSDGPPNTFQTAADTNIPALAAYVHTTTSKRRAIATQQLLTRTSDFLNQVQLYASASGSMSPVSSEDCERIFAKQQQLLKQGLDFHIKSMVASIERRVDSQLKPAMQTGAEKGKAAALNCVSSWGSKNRRTKQDRGGGGLYYSTYLATIRRNGAYASPTAGPIDFNQELADPVEKAFMVGWDKTMNTAIQNLLAMCQAAMAKQARASNQQLCEELCRLQSSFSQRLPPMMGAANNAVDAIVNIVMAQAKTFATEQQREISRELLPEIQSRMAQGYTNATGVQGGSGKYNRMKEAVTGHSDAAMNQMFSASTQQMLKQIAGLIDSLQDKASGTHDLVLRKMRDIYSVIWENASFVVDEASKTKIAQEKMQLEPVLNALKGKLMAASASVNGTELPPEDAEVDGMDATSDHGDGDDGDDGNDDGGNNEDNSMDAEAEPAGDGMDAEAEPAGDGMDAEAEQAGDGMDAEVEQPDQGDNEPCSEPCSDSAGGGGGGAESYGSDESAATTTHVVVSGIGFAANQECANAAPNNTVPAVTQPHASSEQVPSAVKVKEEVPHSEAATAVAPTAAVPTGQALIVLKYQGGPTIKRRMKEVRIATRGAPCICMHGVSFLLSAAQGPSDFACTGASAHARLHVCGWRGVCVCV